MADRSGQQIDKYRLIRQLGEGGFAEVYLGEHIYMQSQAAVKILNIGKEQPDALIQSFLAEVRAITRLRHPNIVRILDCGVDPQKGLLYIIMEYAPQGSLRAKHKLGEQVELSQVISYVKQLANALQFAHGQGYMHRDVKPENVLIGPDGTLWLSDFGLVAQSHNTESLKTMDARGTTPYKAPEQIQKHPRAASDQYALAIMAYEWLCGARPFEGEDYQILYQHIYVPAPSLREKLPMLPQGVEQVILRALAKDARDRFPTIKDFADTLKEAAQESKSAKQWFEEGLIYFDTGNDQRAAELFSKAIEVDAEYAEAYIYRARTYNGLHKYEQALADTSYAIQLNPNHYLAYYARGYAYHGLKEYQRAISNSNKAISLNPLYVDAYNNRGIAYQELKQYQQAITDFTQAIKLNPSYAKAYTNRGIAYYELKQYQQAIAEYTQAIKLNPADADGYYNRGLTYNKLQQYQQAIADYTQAISLNPSDAQAYNSRGNAYGNFKQYQRAIADYTQAIRLNPSYALAYNNRGFTYEEMGLLQQAKQDYEYALVLDPHLELARNNLEYLKTK